MHEWGTAEWHLVYIHVPYSLENTPPSNISPPPPQLEQEMRYLLSLFNYKPLPSFEVRVLLQTGGGGGGGGGGADVFSSEYYSIPVLSDDVQQYYICMHLY